jgi:N utilization substance protein B
MDEKNIFKCFDEILPVESAYREFTVNIFRGVCSHQDRIDSLIEKYADNWEIDRMATIDRNIMRIAAYEMLYTKDTPVSVIIDEAVEIAKRFSNKDSSKFVNGILDKLKDER